MYLLFAVNSNAGVDSKMRVIESAIISERDLINGVDEQVVRHNFIRLLINGGQSVSL